MSNIFNIVAASVLCCLSFTAHAQHRLPVDYCDIVKCNGNEIMITVPQIDTILSENPETGEIFSYLITHAQVTRLNGKPVYSALSDITPANTGEKGWERTIEKRLRRELRQSRNYFDEVWIVVDKNGKPAYLDVKYRETPSPDSDAHMPEKKKVAITRRITRKLSALQFTPAKNGSEAVPYFLVFR